MDLLRHYAEVVAVDFEFTVPPGERPTPICAVVRELRSGRVDHHWLADGVPSTPPYGTGPDTLFIAYYASAELGCHLALGWPMPARILDLFVEFRNLTSGLSVPCGHGLLGALAYYGLPTIDATEKEEWRQLAIRGGPFTEQERQGMLAYCQTDVHALGVLWSAMASQIDLPRAIYRGRYMAAAARMEFRGVPVDAAMVGRLRKHWDSIKSKLVVAVNERFPVFEPIRRRTLNPQSVYGSAILTTAAEWNIDAHSLADAVDMLWEQERETDQSAAMKAARKATGLNAGTINRLENIGLDHDAVLGLDDVGQELAGMFPDLGIGLGYDAEAPDEDDHAGRLWDKLRAPQQRRKRHDPSLIREAGELVSSQSAGASTCQMRFSAAKFSEYLARCDIAWPRLDTGLLQLDDDTFKEMARLHPEQVAPIREVRHTLSQMRLNELAVGSDGRNRCMLSVFGSRSSRNQPSNTRFIFGPSAWLRSIIRPEPGRAIAYIDWSQQELAIAARLSGDQKMQGAYVSGDFYLTFGKMAGAIPADATKATHGKQRDQFKVVCLGVLYGLAAEGLARKLGVTPCEGRELLRLHQETFRQFWRWAEGVQDLGMLGGELRTCFGWTTRAGIEPNPRSLRNFPMQAHGAEMMRAAACLATEQGIEVCCPVHDAFLIEAPTEEIDAEAERMVIVMRQASELVLPGFPLRTDAKIVRWPDRYLDPRGATMWETVCRLLNEAEAEQGDGITDDTPFVSPVIPLSPLLLSS